jgi:hypothetical protein
MDYIGWWWGSTFAEALLGGSSAYFTNRRGTRFRLGEIRGRGVVCERRIQTFFIPSKSHWRARLQSLGASHALAILC